jgi:hypothetical protein
MPQTVEQIEAELREKFSATFAASTHFQKYCEIGAFLSSLENCKPALIQLERSMDHEVQLRVAKLVPVIKQNAGMTFSPEALFSWLFEIRRNRWRHATKEKGRLLSEYDDYSEALFSKVLTDVLTAWEHGSGFDIAPNDRSDILVSVPTSLFNAQLDSKRPFKDYGAGPEHGEFSHRIQWYLLGNGLGINDAAALYKDVKRFISREELAPADLPFSKAKRYVWECLFDRDGFPSNAASVAFNTGTDKLDFRAPSNLNRYLISKEAEASFPLLNLILSDRFYKRSKINLGMGDYVLKKAPNVPKAQLVAQADRTRNGPVHLAATANQAHLDALKSGLFIRRGGRVVAIDWQAWRDE